MYIKSINIREDKVSIVDSQNNKTDFSIDNNYQGWFLQGNITIRNDFIFNRFKIPKSIQGKILGYRDCFGIFPYCRSREDLIKLLKGIQKQSIINYSKQEI